MLDNEGYQYLVIPEKCRLIRITCNLIFIFVRHVPKQCDKKVIYYFIKYTCKTILEYIEQ